VGEKMSYAQNPGFFLIFGAEGFFFTLKLYKDTASG